MSEMSKAPQIIDALKNEAADILSSVLGTKALESFDVGSLGNFPHTWESPNNLKFNPKCYNWINASVAAGEAPYSQDGVFINTYINALGSVFYGYSTEDTSKLNEASSNSTQQGAALLKAWVAAGNTLPPGNQPLDEVVTIIQTDWAKPSVTLNEMYNARNLSDVLNNTPPSGQSVLGPLANWLQAYGQTVSLLNQSTMNTGYLREALRAAQSPAGNNGAVELSDGSYAPAFPVATSQADILNGLKNESNKVSLAMSVSRATTSEFSVTVTGGTGFRIPLPYYLSIGVGGNAKYFSESIATTDNKVEVEMEYTGVSMVSFGPANFDASSGLNWYWMDPIREAIKNQDRDVTGFKFAPNPGIDFGANGPFGFLTNVAIANYPTVRIKVTSENYQSIQQTFEQNVSSTVRFLGIPLASVSESTYSNNVQVDENSKTVTIELSPPPTLVANTENDAVSWILGAVIDHPASYQS